MIKSFIWKHKLEIKLLTLFAMCGAISALGYNKLMVKKIVANDEVRIYENTKFPNLKVAGYENKSDLYSTLQTGKYLIVFVSTRCNGCQLEGKVLQNSKLFEEANIKTIIVGAEEEEVINEFVNKYNLDAQIYYDKDYSLKSQLEINFTPTNYLIENGEIKRSWIGSPTSKEELFQKIGITIY
jgi:peroxiredoxin